MPEKLRETSFEFSDKLAWGGRGSRGGCAARQAFALCLNYFVGTQIVIMSQAVLGSSVTFDARNDQKTHTACKPIEPPPPGARQGASDEPTRFKRRNGNGNHHNANDAHAKAGTGTNLALK